MKTKIFVVHPFETGDGGYHVSYAPNHNRTNKSFRTMAAAKKHIKRIGMKLKETHFMYDHPSGTKFPLTGYKPSIKRKISKRRKKISKRRKKIGMWY